MKSLLLLLLTVLPLVISQTGKIRTACKCARVECPDSEPARCRCQNKVAIACGQLCGTVPQVRFCPFYGQPLSSMTPTITEPTTTISSEPTTTSSIESTTTISIEPTTVPAETSATATSLPGPQKCGTLRDRACPPDQSCVTDPATPGCDDCSGICVPPQRCGSRGLKPCPDGRFCVNDPNDPFCSTDFDCPGYCVLLDGNDCSNEFGIACPSSQQVCVDDPTDDCFPGGGLVCLGKCTFLNGRSSAAFLEE